MKKFKTIFTRTLLIFSIVLAFASCKKEAQPKNVEEQIFNTNELSPYYIVVEHKESNNRIGLIYFVLEGNVIKANFQGDGYLYTKEIKATKNGFSFDPDGTGNYVYHFDLEKNAQGRLNMKSYQFIDKTSASQELLYADIFRKADAPAFENISFETNDYIIFNVKKEAAEAKINWDIQDRLNYTTIFFPPNTYIPVANPYVGPEFSKPCQYLNGLGWKENTGILMGVSVPQWKEINKQVMLVEKGNTLYVAIKYTGG